MTLSEIKEAIGNIDLSNCKTKLNGCENIRDIYLFVNSHINYLEGNPQNKAYLPYYNRLLTFVKLNT